MTEAGDKNIYLTFFKIALVGAPLWWILGINLIVYHLFAIAIFMLMVHIYSRYSHGIYFPPSAVFILFLALAYTASILLHMSSSDITRVFASCYNLSFWIIGFFLVVVFSNVFRKRDIGDILNHFYTFSFITGILSTLIMGYAFITHERSIMFHSLMYGLTEYVGKSTLAGVSVIVRPLFMDWFASTTGSRLNLFSPYPTATGGMLMIVLIMITTRAASKKELMHPIFLILFMMNLLGMVMTLSRITVLAFLVSFIVVLLAQTKKFPLWVSLFVFLLLITMPFIEKLLEWVMGLRGDSTGSRIALYRYSLQQLRDIDWILGLGVKPRTSVFYNPLGSHSTYVSLIFKTGIIGFLVFIGFQINLLWRWYQLKGKAAVSRVTFFFWRGIGWILMAFPMWMLTEDIDAPQLLAFLYFSIIGIFEGHRRELLS